MTGGSRGIGRETVRRFLEEGARVFTCARNEEALAETCAGLAAETGGEIHYAVADTSNAAELAPLVERAQEKLGSIDILVNNAGTMSSGRFEVLDDDALQKQLDTKLFGFLRLIRLVEPEMRAKGWGRIVNMIGGAGKEPDPYMFGSGMTNSALLNMTKSLSTEFGEAGIHVNAVCPGWVDTALWRMNAEGLAAELADGLRRRGPPPRGTQKRAGPFRQARRVGRRHRLSLLGKSELHHRNFSQSRRRQAQIALVGARFLGSRFCSLPPYINPSSNRGLRGFSRPRALRASRAAWPGNSCSGALLGARRVRLAISSIR